MVCRGFVPSSSGGRVYAELPYVDSRSGTLEDKVPVKSYLEIAPSPYHAVTVLVLYVVPYCFGANLIPGKLRFCIVMALTPTSPVLYCTGSCMFVPNCAIRFTRPNVAVLTYYFPRCALIVPAHIILGRTLSYFCP